MKVVGIKVLKNSLSKYLRFARDGERVLISDRDEIVAELVAHKQPSDVSLTDVALAEMMQLGVLRPAADLTAPLPARRSFPGRSLVQELLSDRESR